MRQAPYLIAQLGLIQGNITEYIDGTTKANKVSLDAEKAMENWTYQLKIARNTMTAFATTTSGFMDYVGKDMLKIFNAVTGGIVKMTQSGTLASHSFGVLKDITLAVGLTMASLRLGELTTQFLGLGKAVRAVGDTLVLVRAASGGLEKLRMLFTTGGGWMLTLAAIAAIVVGITSTINRMNEASRQATIEEIKRNRELDQINKKMKVIEALLVTQVRIYRDIAGMDWTKEWEKGYDIIGATLDKLKEFAELIDITSKLRVINIDDVDLGVATKLTETIEEKVKDINIKLLEDKDLYKTEKKIEKFFEGIDNKAEAFVDKRSPIQFSKEEELEIEKQYLEQIKDIEEEKRDARKQFMDLSENDFNFLWETQLKSEQSYIKESIKENLVKQKIQEKSNKEYLKLEKERQSQIKQILQEEYKIYQQNELKKIKLSEIGNSNILRSMKGTNVFDVITKGTFNDAKTLIDYLKEINHEMTVPASELFNQRLELMSSNLANINKQAETYTNYLNRVNQLYTDIRIEAFTNFLKINPDDIKGLDDYIEKAKEFKIFYEGINGDQDTTENIIKGFVKELENVGATQVQIDLMVKEDSFLTTLSQYKALTDSVSNLKEGLAGLKKIPAEGGVTTLSPEDVSAILEANKENIIKSGLMTEEEFQKQLENGEKNTLDFIKMIESLLKKAGDTKTIFFKNIFSTLSKEQKKALTDLFFYYDETTLRELKLQESQQKGLQQIETKRKILAEEMKMSKAKFNFDMLQLKNADKIGILQQKNGENEQEYLKNTLDLLIKRKEEVEKGGVLAEETAEYKDIEKAIKLVQDQQQKLNDEKVKGQEYDKDEKKTIEDTRKYYEELSNKYKELKNTTLTDNFDKLNASIQDSNKNISSQSDLMKILTDKEKELYKLSISEKEIDDEKKNKLEKELETLKLILGIYTDITKEQEKSLDELDKGFEELATNIQKIFDSVKPEKSIKKQLTDSYANLSKVAGKPIKNEEEAFKNLLQVQKEVSNIQEEINSNNLLLKHGNLDDASKKAIEDRIEALKKELEAKKEITEETEKTSQKQKEYTQNLINSVKELSSFVTALTKGESIQFDTGSAIQSGMGVLGKLFASKGKEILHTEDYLALSGMAVGALDNVMKQSFDVASQQLETEISILEFRKQFAKSEEDIAKYSKEILEKQKQQIDLQYQSQTSFMGVSGTTGSALEGAFSGAMAGAASGKAIVAVVGGILGGLGGLFGGKKEKEQAEYQKKMIELQYVQNDILDQQNKILATITEAVDTLSENLYKGINRAISESISTLTQAPKWSVTFGKNIEDSFVELQESYANNPQYQLPENYIENLASENGIPIGTSVDMMFGSGVISQEYDKVMTAIEDGYEFINTVEIKTLDDFDAVIDSIDNTIAEMDKLLLLEEDAEGADKQIEANKLLLEQYKEQLEILQEIYTSRQDVLIGSYFGFEIQQIKDENDNLLDIALGNWEIREDIINNIKDSSYDVGADIAGSFLNGYSSYMIANNEIVQSSLDNIEDKFKDLFQYKADEMKGFTTDQQESLIKDIITEVAKIEEEQIKIQQTAIEVNKAYVELGGNLSDIVNNMTDIENTLYDVFTGGDFADIGSTIGEQVSIGIMKSIEDTYTSIFDIESKIQQLASETTLFDEDFISKASELVGYGEKFNELTLEQIKDKEYVKELMLSIGYTEDQINDSLINQVQKELYIQQILEEQSETSNEILTLKEEISELESDISRDIEEYVTKLYDGRFVEQNIADILNTQEELTSKRLSEEILLNTVVKEWITNGGKISDIVNNMTDIENTLYDVFTGGDFADIGSTIGEQISVGIMKSIEDTYTSIFDIESKIQQLASETTLFDEDFISKASELVNYGEKFNELTLEQIKDKEYVKELMLSIGYTEEQINDSLINQVQKELYIQQILEEQSETSNEILTLKEEISELESDISRDIEEYVTKLYDGRFVEQNIADILNTQEELTSKRLSEEILLNAVAKEWIVNGGKISDIMNTLSESGQAVYNAMSEALDADSYESSVESLNTYLIDKFTEAWKTDILDKKFASTFTNLSALMSSAVNDGLSFTAVQTVASQFQKFNLQAEAERQKLLALTDMLSYNQEVSYDTSTNQVEYTTGSTSTNNYNYYNTFQISGVVPLTTSSINEFVDVIDDRIITNLKGKGAI